MNEIKNLGEVCLDKIHLVLQNSWDHLLNSWKLLGWVCPEILHVKSEGEEWNVDYSTIQYKGFRILTMDLLLTGSLT